MAYRKYKLGDLVEQYDEINQNGEFTEIDDLQGINSNKYFQECKSNKNDIDLFRYRICRHGMFSYNRATSRNGEKISIALRTGDDCIVSPSYYCFRVKDEEILCPEYLDIWFKRPVFDRYARFNSWGSATEFFTFDDFCATEIMLPSLPKQRKLVHDYQVITDRIELLRKMNENLEELMVVELKDCLDDVPFAATLDDYCLFQEGYVNPPQENTEYFYGDIKWLRGVDFTSPIITRTSRTLTNEGFESAGKSALFFQPNTIVITKSGTIGKLGIIADYMCGNRATINITPKDSSHLPCLYFFLRSIQTQFQDLAVGTAQVNLYVSVMQTIPCPAFDESFDTYNTKAGKILQDITLRSKEIDQLEDLLSLLLGSISQ